MSLSLDLPEDLLDNSETSLDHLLMKGSANENDSSLKQDDTELILDENTKTGIQLDLPSSGFSSMQSSSLKPDLEENKEDTKEDSSAQQDRPSEPSEDMTIPDDTQSVKAEDHEEKAPENSGKERPATPQSPLAPPSDHQIPSQSPSNPELGDKGSTPIMDRKKSFHILDDEDGSESCSTPKIAIPLEFVTPNKSQSSELLSDRSLDESNTQECIFTAAQPTPERKKLAEILAKQAGDIIDMRNLGDDSGGCEASSETNFDKDFSTEVNKVSEVTFTINSKDVEAKPPKRRRRAQRRKIEDDLNENEDENDIENEIEVEEEKEEDTPKEPSKKGFRKLRRIASLLREEKEEKEGKESGEKESKEEGEERETAEENKDRYSLKSVLEALDFDTYKNSLFEYDDALSDKSSSEHLSIEPLTESEPSPSASSKSTIASRKHNRAPKKKPELGKGGYSELGKADVDIDDEPAPKKAKRSGLPCFGGLRFFLTRIPHEAREAIQGVIAGESIIGTTEGAFEYVTCCDRGKRFRDPKTFLVAVQPIRTAKYILALALGVPCVSQEWIAQSAEAGKLCDYRDFLLPRGFSVLEKTLVPAKSTLEEACPLDGYRIELLVQVCSHVLYIY